MWGAHSVAQALAGLDMANVSSIEFAYEGPDATMVTRLSNGVKLVLFRAAGSVWEPCKYWHGACGERFDGPEGWAGGRRRLFERPMSHRRHCWSNTTMCSPTTRPERNGR